jgi:hypothetical protein
MKKFCLSMCLGVVVTALIVTFGLQLGAQQIRQETSLPVTYGSAGATQDAIVYDGNEASAGSSNGVFVVSASASSGVTLVSSNAWVTNTDGGQVIHQPNGVHYIVQASSNAIYVPPKPKLLIDCDDDGCVVQGIGQNLEEAKLMLAKLQTPTIRKVVWVDEHCHRHEEEVKREPLVASTPPTPPQLASAQ